MHPTPAELRTIGELLNEAFWTYVEWADVTEDIDLQIARASIGRLDFGSEMLEAGVYEVWLLLGMGSVWCLFLLQASIRLREEGFNADHSFELVKRLFTP